MSQQDPSVGRIVHFGQLDLDESTGDVVLVPRAATVVSVGADTDNGIVNLFVMAPSTTFHVIGVHYSETLKKNCWTWPVRS